MRCWLIGRKKTRYRDSSALVPLFVKENNTDRMRQLLQQDPTVITWWATEIECVSAISRLKRDGELLPQTYSKALLLLDSTSKTWNIVEPVVAVSNTAKRLLSVHSLRAADALQLAAATASCRNQPNTLAFVCLDKKLSEVAEREGFFIEAS